MYFYMLDPKEHGFLSPPVYRSYFPNFVHFFPVDTLPLKKMSYVLYSRRCSGSFQQNMQQISKCMNIVTHEKKKGAHLFKKML
jgi:hypothetical protein